MKYKFLKSNKINFSSIFLLGVFWILILIPNKTFSASLYLSSEGEVSAGDTSIIEIFLDTENELINSISGSVVLTSSDNSNFKIQNISLVNSVFNMWPRKPSLEKEQKISFIGGIPGGVKGDHLLLFKIIVSIDKSGSFSLSPEDVVAYINDGLGTSRIVSKDISTIAVKEASNIPKNKWEEIISNDKIAPNPFEIEILQDSSLYDGKKFISFETTDAQSGISYYEVKEGNNSFVRTGTNYVLMDQDGKNEIVVVAYDKAGNFQISKLNESVHWLSIVVSVVLVFVIYLFIKLIVKKIKNKNAKSVF